MSVENVIGLLFSTAFLIFMLLVVVVIVSGYVLSKISEKKYKRAIIKIILGSNTKKESEKLESIKNTYQNYIINGSFSYLAILDINAKLIAELRDETYKKYYKGNKDVIEKDISELERLNKLLRDEFSYSDQKLNNVLSEVKLLSTDECKSEKACGEIKVLYSALISYCDGRIFEKQNEIMEKETEIKKIKSNRWFNRIGWIVGIVSGILTIISFKW